MALRLSQLPDRTPGKLTVTLAPELRRALDDYALLYAQAYGVEEQVADLVPAMLEAFLKADFGFQKARKDLKATLMLPLQAKTTMRRNPKPEGDSS